MRASRSDGRCRRWRGRSRGAGLARLEAFLEMLAAERGAARLTLAAYRNDLADLAGFLAARGIGARRRRCGGAARLSGGDDDAAPSGAAHPGAAAVGDAPVLPLSGQRRRARRRPDGRSRHAAARPAAAENPQPRPRSSG